MLKGIGARGDGTWDECLLKERAALGEIMDAFMERAPKEFAHALPGDARSPEEEEIECALRYARLVTGCKPFAAAGAFGASLEQAEQDMSQSLRRHSDELVRELRQAGAKDRALLERQFERNVRLTAALFGEADAEFLRRRGRGLTTLRAQ